MQYTHRIGTLAIVAGLIGFLGCDLTRTSPTSPPPVKTTSEGVAPASSSNVEIGDPLFPAKAVKPPAKAPGSALAADPIVVRQCQVTLAQIQNVPSKNSGRLLEYCTDVGPVPPSPELTIRHPRTGKIYRKLSEGDVIKPGQLIGFLDDKLAAANMAIEEAAKTANAAKADASNRLLEASTEEYQMYLGLYKQRAGSESDMRRSKAQMHRAEAELEEAKGQLLKSNEDVNKAKVQLEEHEVRSTIGGTIKRFYRHPGDSIKELEAVAEVQNLDKLRIEGLLDVQYLPILTQLKASGKPVEVIVETAPQYGPTQQLDGHLQAVKAVAVSKDPQRPLIVSVGEDKTARVWERASKEQRAILPHPVAVRAVACTPPGGEGNWCLTGADDGLGRLWNLDNAAPAKTMRELKGRHSSRIVSAAFSPNGKFCATADDRDIYLWDVGSGELKYRFPQHHRGPITFVQFTPLTELISVARDRTLIVWKLGTLGAAPAHIIEHRAGDVPVLGTSPDGQSVLFDQERSLHILSIADQRTEGVMAAPTEVSQFSSFAIFSPDGRMVLAAGTADIPLQLWKAPQAGVRGHMIRRLAAGATSTSTCAAFAPDGSFAVTGTADNKVLVWAMPTDNEIKTEVRGSLTFLDRAIDAADRKARIWAELQNPEDGRLLPGETVHMVIPIPGSR